MRCYGCRSRWWQPLCMVLSRDTSTIAYYTNSAACYTNAAAYYAYTTAYYTNTTAYYCLTECHMGDRY